MDVWDQKKKAPREATPQPSQQSSANAAAVGAYPPRTPTENAIQSPADSGVLGGRVAP